MSDLLTLVVVALCNLISLEMWLVSSEDRKALAEVARAKSSCLFVIRISMTMPFASTVVVKRRVIELFFIVIGPQPTASSIQCQDTQRIENLHLGAKTFAACAALYLRSIWLTKF